MNRKQEIIFYSVLLFLGVVAVILVIFLDNKSLVKENKKENNSSPSEVSSSKNQNDLEETKPSEENKFQEADNNVSNNQSNVEDNNVNSSTNNKTNSNVNNNNNNNTNSNSTNQEVPTENYSQNDLLVIKELNELDNSTDLLLKSGNDESISSKAKGIFITLVDFCFYDGKINGITFNELTESGKAKVLKIASKIDEKIENKFPGYKEKITSKATDALKKASVLIKKGAQNVNEFAQDKLGDKNYQALIDEKDELVLYTKNAWSLVKNFGTSIYQKTTSKLKEWYEKFRK